VRSLFCPNLPHSEKTPSQDAPTSAGTEPNDDRPAKVKWRTDYSVLDHVSPSVPYFYKVMQAWHPRPLGKRAVKASTQSQHANARTESDH
jgi:hypothetical protein